MTQNNQSPKPRSVWLIRPSFFLWVLVVLVIYGAVEIYGLPHIRSQYRYLSQAPHDPFAYRYYTQCTYFGFYGAFTLNTPAGGKCPIFKFYRSEGDA